MHRYIEGGCQEEGPDTSHWCPATGQGAAGTNKQEIPPKPEEELLYFEVEQALEEAAQRGCGVSSCSNPTFLTAIPKLH